MVTIIVATYFTGHHGNAILNMVTNYELCIFTMVTYSTKLSKRVPVNVRLTQFQEISWSRSTLFFGTISGDILEQIYTLDRHNYRR